MGIRLSASEAIALGARLDSRFEELGMTQLKIEDTTGVDQSQISRIFAGDFKFVTPKVEALCKKAGIGYAKNGGATVRDRPPPAGPHEVPPAEAEKLHTVVLQAFESIWDGSPRHAAAIGDLIRAAGPLFQGNR